MKIRDGFVLREIASNMVVLPVGRDTVNFNGMLSLNESGVILWRVLENGGDRDAMVEALLSEYDVKRDEACADVDFFIEKLQKAGCIE